MNKLSALATIIEDADNELPMMVRRLLLDLKDQHDELIDRSDAIYAQLKRWHNTDTNSQLLATIPGVGLLTATAMSAQLGDEVAFRSGRQLAAYLGLVPQQASSGGKHRLLGISKRGDGYLRYLLIQGAKSVIRQLKRRQAMGLLTGHVWLEKLLQRTHPNKAAVALANKMARISWVLVTRNESYQVPDVVST